MNTKKILFLSVILLIATVWGVNTASADHAWGNYHWARTANPFTLELGNNVGSQWQDVLATTAADWSLSSVVNTEVAVGNTRARNCKATNGRVETCSDTYGNNGWLGLAQIWISGSHITKGVVKVNDTYFNTPDYDTPAWRNLVMCQEVGHALGLDHTDENFDNTPEGTCMDYSNDPIPNQHPNAHDYDMLATIYAHLDSFNSVFPFVPDEGGGKGNGKGKGGKPALVGQDIDLNNPNAWGQAVRQDARGNNSLYVRNLGNGESLITHVIWVDGRHNK